MTNKYLYIYAMGLHSPFHALKLYSSYCLRQAIVLNTSTHTHTHTYIYICSKMFQLFKTMQCII